MLRVMVTRTLDPVIWGRFVELSKETKIPATRLLDEAMEDLIEKRTGGKKG